MNQVYQGVQFAESLTKVTAAVLRKTEKRLHVAFPEEYRDFLATVNSGIPTPSELVLAESAEKVCLDFLYGISSSRESNDLDYEQQEILERTDGILPEGFIVIGIDPGGGTYFISTKGDKLGSIYIYDPDGFLDAAKIPRLHLVAHSFSEMLEKIVSNA